LFGLSSALPRDYRGLQLTLCFHTAMGYEFRMMSLKPVRPAAAALILLAFAACTANHGSTMAEDCSQGLATAEKELLDAKAKGFGGAVGLTQAASLIAAAKVQSEFKRYPNCVDKVRRARVHISKAQEG
jgi:hypothetical protein